MKTVSLTFLLFLSFLIFAQKEVPKPEVIQAFKKSTTLIVLDDNPLMSYNFKIKEAIQKTWKITPYKFISVAEYEIMRKSSQNSFLTLDQVYFTKDKTKAEYNFLCLSMGGSAYKEQEDMPQLCTVPVSYLGVDENSYVYKLTALLQIVQDHIGFVESQPDINDINVIHRYNDNMYLIQQKTLYVVKDELAKDINTEAKFKAVYPFAFKFVTREQLEKIIDSKTPNAVFMHKVGPEGTEKNARCYKTIIDAENSKLYFFDYHMIDVEHPDGLLSKDLKKMAKAKPELKKL